MARKPETGSKDIFIIAAIALVIVGALIFVLLRIVGHAEKHVDTVKKTKVKYSESLSWRPDSAISEDKIKADFKNSRNQTAADYGDLNLTKNSFVLISKMPMLRDLKLIRTNFKEKWLNILADMNLRYLALHGTPITDKSIPILLKMKNLESVELGDTEITDKGLEELSASKTINHLEINLGRKITNRGIESLDKMTQLKVLEFSGSKNVTAACLAGLSNLKDLEQLSIKYLTVGSEDLDALKQFKKLILLDASECSLDDRALQGIAAVKSLNVLNINGSNITDDGIEKLSGLKSLSLLSMKDCPNVSEKAAEKLKKRLPGCHIVHTKRSGFANKLKQDNVRMELLLLKDEAKNELEKMK
ncbi:MAG: hypothetical protein KC652_19025 [Cyanobacteria bacterium HKST-UBA01]|nr:hypothetical protein [Cyanobacteria bacterium HKST-UBA01]